MLAVRNAPARTSRRLGIVASLALLFGQLLTADAAAQSCANMPGPNHDGDVAAGAAADGSAEVGGGPLQQGLAARDAYLVVAPDDVCNANNAFVHSYVAGATRQGGRTYDGTETEWYAALADGRVATAIAALDRHLGGPGRSGLTAASVTRTGCSHPPCYPPTFVSASCPLADRLPIVPAYPAEAPGGQPGDSPHPPHGDGSDWVVIMCHPSAPGYRIDTGILWGSAGAGWTRIAARRWLEEQGDTISPMEFRAICRGGPNEGTLVPETFPDRQCFEA